MNNLEKRMDIRDKDQFAKDIQKHTKKENYWANQWFETKIKPKIPNAHLLDNGCDNTGDVILEKATKSADFILEINGKSFTVEAKVSPAGCVTIKEYDLHHADRCDINFYLLVANAEIGKDTKYYLIKRKELVAFMKHGKLIENDPKFGYKPAYRLYLDQLETLFG